ncbi:hypothetical protein [Thermoactinospora rubra]|uniref:hypothetical protein n=1 Tax=Thermoactinospora rubra TaxID=1088767 RepID=UPI001F0AD8F4|nr:hypothetical protein [Thermoactinospora rubra]
MTLPRITALVPALLAALCAACSSGGGGSAAAGNAGSTGHAAHGRPLTVEQLAAKVGCTPRIQVDAQDMRTGHCKTGDGEFFLSTFATQEGKDAWMDTAPEYNPHLVGHLWTALAPREVLEKLMGRLGGELHLNDHRTKSPSPQGY